MLNMQQYRRYLIFLPLLLAVVAFLALPRTTIMQGNLQFGANDVIDGHLLLPDANANFEAGSHLRGALIVLSGNLMINGRIDGGIHILSGNVMIGPQAEINGDIALGSVNFTSAPGARLNGAHGTFGLGTVWLLGQIFCLIPILLTLGGVLAAIQRYRERRIVRG
jgi:hypothetical protein